MKCDEMGISQNFVLPLDTSVKDRKLDVSEIKKKNNLIIITTILCILKGPLTKRKKNNFLIGILTMAMTH